jgi:hypothetical protein
MRSRIPARLVHLCDASYLRQMIMGHDSSPTPPGSLAAETTESLRGALVRYLRASPTGDSGGLRDALRAMASEARQKSILPEHVLVALKQIWFSLPEVHAMRESSEQARLLQRVVSMCIKEYFGS